MLHAKTCITLQIDSEADSSNRLFFKYLCYDFLALDIINKYVHFNQDQLKSFSNNCTKTLSFTY